MLRAVEQITLELVSLLSAHTRINFLGIVLMITAKRVIM